MKEEHKIDMVRFNEERTDFDIGFEEWLKENDTLLGWLMYITDDEFDTLRRSIDDAQTALNNGYGKAVANVLLIYTLYKNGWENRGMTEDKFLSAGSDLEISVIMVKMVKDGLFDYIPGSKDENWIFKLTDKGVEQKEELLKQLIQNDSTED